MSAQFWHFPRPAMILKFAHFLSQVSTQQRSRRSKNGHSVRGEFTVLRYKYSLFKFSWETFYVAAGEQSASSSFHSGYAFTSLSLSRLSPHSLLFSCIVGYWKITLFFFVLRVSITLNFIGGTQLIHVLILYLPWEAPCQLVFNLIILI